MQQTLVDEWESERQWGKNYDVSLDRREKKMALSYIILWWVDCLLI
jgi:hypothetical protein